MQSENDPHVLSTADLPRQQLNNGQIDTRRSSLRAKDGRVFGFAVLCAVLAIGLSTSLTAQDPIAPEELDVESPTLEAPQVPALGEGQPPGEEAAPQGLEVEIPATGPSADDLSEDESAQVTPRRALEAARTFAEAKLLAEEGYLAKALEAYRSALDMDGRDAYAHLETAQFLIYMSQVSRSGSLQGQHVNEAVEHAGKARELAPENADILRQFAQVHLRLVEQNRFDSIASATEAFEALRQIDGEEDLQVLTSLGQLYLWQRQSAKAAEVLHLAAGLRPNFPTIQVMLVEALLGSGEKEQAEGVLESLLELTPEAAEHRLRLAELRSERGDHRGAVAVLKDPSQSWVDHPRLRQALARELHLIGDNGEALELTDSLLAEMPRETGLQRLRVAIFSSLGRYQDAIDTLRPLIDWKSDDVQGIIQDQRLLSRLLERIGQPLEAADELQRLLAKPELERREQLRGKMALVALWERHGMGDKAVDLLQADLQGADEDQRLTMSRLLSDLYRRLGQPDASLEVLDQAGEALSPEQDIERETLDLHRLPALLANEDWDLAETVGRRLLQSETVETRLGGRVLLAQGLANTERLDEALTVLALNDGDAGPLKRRLLADRLELMFEHGRADLARTELSQMGASESLDEVVFAAQVLQGRELYDEVLPLLERVLAEQPESIPSLFLYAAAQERSGRRDAAAKSFERLLTISPDHVPSLNYLGYMWVEEEENLDQALQLIQRAVAFEPDNGAYVDSLGWALVKLGRYEEARGHLEWAALLVPEDPTVHEHLGDLYVLLDDAERAEKAYRSALELGGDEADGIAAKLDALTDRSSL